jgi:hypothetical protein
MNQADCFAPMTATTARTVSSTVWTMAAGNSTKVER